MSIPRINLTSDFSVPRIIKGNWQIADDHSSSVCDDEMYQHMAEFVDAGITAFDCGDIYHGVEERIGNFIERFRSNRGREASEQIAVHTKYCPAFLQEKELREHKRSDVEQVIDRSLKRLKVDRLHLVQLHWWNYDIPGSVETALMLQDLQKAGKIHHIGLTNYNVEELSKVVNAGIDVVSNQVQYSLIDRRPANGMTQYCQDNGIKLLTYGSLGGGLISKKWLSISDPGQPTFENVSLDKYYRIIQDFGGWKLFQELLTVLDDISKDHGVNIPAVASRYVLDQQSVGALIQGARHSRHLKENLRLFQFSLRDEDHTRISEVVDKAIGPAGDCYDIDRIENRDALENVATEYFDVEEGQLVVRQRSGVNVATPYGHHLK